MTDSSTAWQFSLRSLLGAFVVLSICFGLVYWLERIGFVFATSVVGGCLAIVGFRNRRHWATGIGATLVALPLFVLAGDMTVVCWCGHMPVRFVTTVVDEKSKAPIANADIGLFDGEGRFVFTEQTDQHGAWTYSDDWMISGSFSQLGILVPHRPARYPLSYHFIEVSADGYEPVSMTLANATGMEHIVSPGGTLPPVTIELKPIGIAP